MNFILIKASKDHSIVLRHLMQFYMYDFSVYTNHDVAEDGLFSAYTGLESYWDKKEENHKFPYIVKSGEKYIGFALVKFIESEKRSYFSIAEFFILRKYRLNGVGKAVAIQLFSLHKGSWEIYQINSNKPAHLFWKKVIEDFANGKFKQRSEDAKLIQCFES